MPTIKIEKDSFEVLLGKKLPLDQLKDRISMLGTDLEGIEGNEITMEVFPNRPDMLSLQGFTRAFSSFIGHETGLRKYKVHESDYEVIVDKSVSAVRPYTVCAIVKGIHYDDKRIKEVIMVQEKLHITYGRNRRKVAIGIYPFEKITLPIHFKADKPEKIRFQPLESDKEMTGKEILVEHPTGREFAHLLAKADVYPYFIDAAGEILSMPPVINSHRTGKIGPETKDVFIECSGFDLRVLEKSLNMIVTAMADMGGKIYSMKIRYPDRTIVTPNLAPDEMDVDKEYLEKKLGIHIKEADLKKLFEKMGYGYEKGGKDGKSKVQIPAYRADILHQIDLAEDLAIAYGFENFENIIPNVATVGQEAPFEVFKNKLADALAGLGMLEVRTYNLTNRDAQLKRMNIELPVIPLANSISADYDILRAWVIPSLMEILSNNKHNEFPQNLFGYGTVFKKGETDTGVLEQERVAAVLCSDSVDYTKARQALDYIMKCFDVKYTVENAEHASFIPGRVARVFVDGIGIAYVGEISPAVLSNWQLEMPVAAIELNVSEMFGLMK